MFSENSIRIPVQASPKVGRKPKPALTIAIDAGSLSAPISQHGGIATIVRNFIQTASKWDKRNHYFLYTFGNLPEEIKISDSMTVRKLPKLGYSSVWFPQALKKDRPDVLLAFSQFIPKIEIPTIGFIYDIAFIKFPQYFADHVRLQSQTQQLIDRSQHIVVPSHATKKDLIDHFKLDENKLSVIYPGVSENFTPKGPKYVDTLPYFLFVGAFKKSKNIPFIIESFAQFLQKVKKEYRLILVGNTKNQDPGILATITKFQLSESVLVKEYVDLPTLQSLYRGAIATLNPSHYEGFGFPIVESLASGTPVIVGNNSSMVELIGKGGISIDVTDTSAFCDALEKITDPSVQKKFISGALKKAHEFTWKKYFRELEEVCTQVLIGQQ